MKLDGARALVTGGASGLGYAITRALLSEGAHVAFLDLDPARVAAVESELASVGDVRGIVANVSDEASVEAALDDAWGAFGHLDVLVNNAGIIRDGLLVKRNKASGTLETLSLDAWNQVLAVNLTGPFLMTRGFARRCVEHEVRPAAVVNISSVARHGNAGQSNYSAAKAGLAADTKLWGNELARYGIRVGAVAPGFIRTPILEGMKAEMLQKLLATVPLGRLAEPDEVWQAVRFILSCDYFTGRCIDVDGGLTL